MSERSDYQREYRAKYKSKYKYLTVGMPMDDYRRVERAAKKHKKKPTPFFRELAFASLDQHEVIPQQLIDALNEHNRLVRNLANNLNQIAHKTHIFGDVDKSMVFDHLKQLDAQVNDFVHHAYRDE
ncbi:MAG: hypothetical protein AAGF06_06310 [Pseudomonadota bacterium]